MRKKAIRIITNKESSWSWWTHLLVLLTFYQTTSSLHMLNLCTLTFTFIVSGHSETFGQTTIPERCITNLLAVSKYIHQTCHKIAPVWCIHTLSNLKLSGQRGEKPPLAICLNTIFWIIVQLPTNFLQDQWKPWGWVNRTVLILYTSLLHTYLYDYPPPPLAISPTSLGGPLPVPTKYSCIYVSCFSTVQCLPSLSPSRAWITLKTSPSMLWSIVSPLLSSILDIAIILHNPLT